jgi:hypothetical protein
MLILLLLTQLQPYKLFINGQEIDILASAEYEYSQHVLYVKTDKIYSSGFE